MSRRREPTEEDKLGYLTETMRLIDEHGVAIQFVLGGEDYAFAYTVGLSREGHPELLLLALPQGIAHNVLNRLAANVQKSGHTYTDGDVVTDALEGDFPLRVHGPVNDQQYPVNIARSIYGTDVKVLQVLWPDPNGRFGDDPQAIAGAVSPVLPRRNDAT